MYSTLFQHITVLTNLLVLIVLAHLILLRGKLLATRRDYLPELKMKQYKFICIFKLAHVILLMSFLVSSGRFANSVCIYWVHTLSSSIVSLK